MRLTSFLIFFGTALLIYFSFNFHIYSRGLQAFSITPGWKRAYFILFWVVVSCFVIGEILEHTRSSLISEWIYRVGAFWLAFMLYFALTLLVFDVIRLANHFFHFLPELTQLFRFRLGLGTVALVSCLVVAGHINALNTQIRKFSLSIPKKITGSHSMRIVMASDIHLGALIGENREAKLVRIINSQHPDLVLLAVIW